MLSDDDNDDIATVEDMSEDDGCEDNCGGVVIDILPDDKLDVPPFEWTTASDSWLLLLLALLRLLLFEM